MPISQEQAKWLITLPTGMYTIVGRETLTEIQIRKIPLTAEGDDNSCQK